MFLHLTEKDKEMIIMYLIRLGLQDIFIIHDHEN